MKRGLRSLLQAIALCVGALVVAAPNASALTFALLDHGFGLEGEHYGLRLDGEGRFFSVEGESGLSRVSLTWVPESGAAEIAGTLREVDPSTNESSGDFDVFYALTGVTSVFRGSSLIGFEATGGAGLVDSIVLAGKADETGAVFRFLADGFRIPGDNTTIVGRGWLEGGPDFNDWLVKTNDVIPEPATALLFGLGVLALASSRRLRATGPS